MKNFSNRRIIFRGSDKLDLDILGLESTSRAAPEVVSNIRAA